MVGARSGRASSSRSWTSTETSSPVRGWVSVTGSTRDKIEGGSNTGTQVKHGLTATEDGGVILSFVGGQSTTTDYEAKTS